MIRSYDNYDLRGHNSFGVEARAAKLVEFDSAEELIAFASENNGIFDGKWAVLGGGNNILFTQDYDGTLLHPTNDSIRIFSKSGDDVCINVSAGCDWDEFVSWCVRHGMWGIENLTHIPSSVGAAPVQNIGAYGVEVKDTVMSVEILHVETLKTLTIACEHCGFGYRESIFKNALRGKAIITSVNFRLSRAPRPEISYGALREEVMNLGGETIGNIRQAVINIRKAKLPDPAETGNAGSFFKNPVVPAETAARLAGEYPGMPQYPDACTGNVKLAAGWLIDKAGWRGRSIGKVGVYDKQALIIVNRGGATGAEIATFSELARQAVFEEFGISIEPEVNIW